MELDVREDLRQGRAPFGRIMQAVDGLGPGEPLVLVAPFEPVPLYRVMETRGFLHATERTADGAWRVTFTKATADE